MERTNHTSVNNIRIVKQKLHGPNEKDHSRNIMNTNNVNETNWRIINHTSNKMNIWYWVFNMPSKNLIMAFGSRKDFVLCTNVQTSIIWFLRMCFFVNGLIMLNKHITISIMTIRDSKQFSKVNRNKSSAFQLIIILIRLLFSIFFLLSQVCF